METASYSQSLANSLTASTILPGVILFPEGTLRGSDCPVAKTLTLEPPTSTTRILVGVAAADDGESLGVSSTIIGGLIATTSTESPRPKSECCEILCLATGIQFPSSQRLKGRLSEQQCDCPRV